MQLNTQQQEAVDAIDGVWVVVAGPGSGKTTVMMERYRNILNRGILFTDILNLTFTASAAEQMANRAGWTNTKSVFRTFHSFALEVMKKERDCLPFKLSEEVIPVRFEDYKLIETIAKSLPIKAKTLREKITKWKCDNILPGQAIEENRYRGVEYYYASAYEQYEERSRQEGWLDFDNCILETVRLFESNLEVRNRWKKKYISVDECQDTDEKQFRLLQLIFDGNIFAVGDENQLIYEWRSAQSNNLTNFSQKFSGAKTLYLGQNYRSTGKLVSFFKEIIPVDNGLATHMVTVNEAGLDPVITEFQNDYQEASVILKNITDPVNTAVLARTNRQLFIFQKLCTNREIKYNFLGKDGFWQQPEVKALLKLAKETKDTGPADLVLASLIYDHNLLSIYRNFGDVDNDPVRNLNDAVKMSVGKGTVPEFLNYLRRLTYALKADKRLTLSTVHQAKGREYHNVYLIGVSEGKMPHRDGEYNEEKRIFFVGCSRAAKQLNISYYGTASSFLTNYLDRIKYYQEKQNETI